jgi:amino-acid N-acetyltransferase
MKVEKAKIADVPQIHKLVNYFAAQGRMLPRSLSEIYENLRGFFVVREGDEVVACVALYIYWHDLVEIKSLAVAEEKQDTGLGTALVKECIEEARSLGMPTVFCLTYHPTFFEQFGFHRVGLTELPRKIWGECQRCPKYPDCDETAMILQLKPSVKVEW